MNGNLDWILEDALVVPGALHAILLSADGLLRAHTQNIDRDEAERQAAGLSGLQSISRNTADFCNAPDTPWRQTLVEFDAGYVFVVAAGAGAYLAVSTDSTVDMEAVTYRMHKLVDRLGKEMNSLPRSGTDDFA